MAEDLDLRGTRAADRLNVPRAQLPREHDALHAELRREVRAAEGEQAHLRARVQGNVRRGLARHVPKAPVLHEHGVDPHGGGLFQRVRRLRQLPVGEQRVERQIDLYPVEVTVVYGGGKVVVREIFRAAAGVERAEAHVDGVRAALYGGLKRLARAGGREKLHRCLLHHLRFCWWPCWFCALKSWRLRSEISSR